MTAIDTSNRDRQARFKERREQAGLVRVEVYVPADAAEKIKQIAADLRGNRSNPGATHETR
jgi:hypothetical protein